MDSWEENVGNPMMNEERFLRWVAESDSRYHPNAYTFVLEALRYTQHYFKRPRHVTGKELLVGIARFARVRFGEFAWTVFQEWGVRSSRDFGIIVFNLVEIGEIKKTEDDTIEDFDIGFDLEKALGQVEIPG